MSRVSSISVAQTLIDQLVLEVNHNNLLPGAAERILSYVLGKLDCMDDWDDDVARDLLLERGNNPSWVVRVFGEHGIFLLCDQTNDLESGDVEESS